MKKNKIIRIVLAVTGVLSGLLVPRCGRCEVTLTVVASFTGTNGTAPGALPEAGLARAADGSFYGTTLGGGTNGNLGTIFKIGTNGTLTTLFSFSGPPAGSYPQAGLEQGTDGNFYGATTRGGTTDDGTVFRITADGVFTQLASLDWANGVYPNGLLQARDGNFYGTAYAGGTNGYGTVFKVSQGGEVSTVYCFGNITNASGVGLDGERPQAGLVEGDDGNLYGTTTMGGAYGPYGTVFKLSTNGTFTCLHSFDGTNGANPLCKLNLDSHGTLYGTASAGGMYFNNAPVTGNGTVFKLFTNGQFTTLHFFAGYPDEGAAPGFIGLARGTDGNLYGTTSQGGENGSGTVFSLAPDGTLTTLYSFTCPDYSTGTNSDGCSPSAALVQGADGDFYGVAMNGGTMGLGVAFRLSSVSFLLPRIQEITKTAAAVSLAWTPLPARSYQVQYKTDLNQPNWSNSGNVVTANHGTLKATDEAGSDIKRFYRVILLP